MRRQITQDDLNNFPFLKDMGCAVGQELDFNEEGFPTGPEAGANATQSGSENGNGESLTDGKPEGESQTNGESEEKSEEKTDETENTENTEETTESEKLTDGEGGE